MSDQDITDIRHAASWVVLAVFAVLLYRPYWRKR